MDKTVAVGYTVDSSIESRDRLISLEEALDPRTTRRLEALGVGPGWHCAEVGAGAGSITRWLSSRVGPAGRVLAVDLDTRFLNDLQESNVEVREADVTSSDLEHSSFDLLHTRAVLIHIPARDQVLPKLVRAVRPGGWLLLEEVDCHPIVATATGSYREVWEAFLTAWTASGAAADWARRLPQLLDGLAVEAVESETTIETFRGGTRMARAVQAIFNMVREPLLSDGLRDEVLDNVLAMLDTPTCWFPGFALVAAWGQRAAT